VHERVSARGEILVPFDLESARAPLEDAYHAGIRAVAIVFLHGYRYPEHERQAAALAREIGFTYISVSHPVNPLMKLACATINRSMLPMGVPWRSHQYRPKSGPRSGN